MNKWETFEIMYTTKAVVKEKPEKYSSLNETRTYDISDTGLVFH